MKHNEKKSGWASSALSGKRLHGMAKQKSTARIRTAAKTKRRPSAMFSGILSGQERRMVFEEAAKIFSGEKTIEQTDSRIRVFVEQAIKKMGE